MKMSKKFEKLNETFNTEQEEVSIVHSEVESEVEKIEKISSAADDIRKDYEYYSEYFDEPSDLEYHWPV